MGRYRLALLALFVAFTNAHAYAQETGASEAVETITHEEIYNFCRRLASPEFEGRYSSH